MHDTEIVGYTFAADTYCPRCITDALPTGEGQAFDGWALAPGIHMSAEENLNEVAAAFGIEREKEETFDTSEFPKVISADQAHDDTCAACGEELV